MNNNLNELLDQVNHHTEALLWYVDSTSIDENPYFAALDYLFDGLISRTKEDLNQSQKIDLLTTQQFGKNLYLFKIPKDKFSSSDIDQVISESVQIKDPKNIVSLS